MITNGGVRVLTVGDVHGCLRALRALDRLVAFGEDDQLVLLGDYVDRGPDSRGVIDWVLERERRMSVVALRGNHDWMMLRARADEDLLEDWLAMGGKETLESYGTSRSKDWVAVVPAAHWEFLERTLLYWETERFLFVHGGLDADRPLEEQSLETLMCGRCPGTRPHGSGRQIICGHTAHKDGEIGCFDFGYCIDTAACRGGWLTCLEPVTGLYWQASEAGETRTGRISNLLRPAAPSG